MTHPDHQTVANGSLTPVDFEHDYLRSRAEFMPWTPRMRETEREQTLLQQILRRHGGATSFGHRCYIAPNAHVFTDNFSIGDRSTIAAGALVRGDITIGCGSSINPFAHIAGKVTIGNDVMIAGLVSIYGFSHGYARTDIPMSKQDNREQGVVIGDDCWIGANAVILDGVVVGRHVLIAAGAVVTKSVPDGVIVGGNPARIIKKRT